MAERLIAPVLKTGLPARVAGVRIPLPPLVFARKISGFPDFSAKTIRLNARKNLAPRLIRRGLKPIPRVSVVFGSGRPF